MKGREGRQRGERETVEEERKREKSIIKGELEVY